jgi:putative hemolysin
MPLKALNQALRQQSNEKLLLQVTRDPALVLQAQKLRYKSFFSHLPGYAPQGVDTDDFDQWCDHLLVMDMTGAEPRVVGTYRLRCQDSAPDKPFYTETEFDISGLKNSGKRLLELGRSCVDSDFRERSVIQLLWRGLTGYLHHFKIDYMFGCGSFDGADPESHALALSCLYHFHRAPADICPTPLPAQKAVFTLLAKEDIDQQKALAKMPPLIKGYLRAGVLVGDGAVVDTVCNTVDVCIIMPTEAMTQRYADKFLEAAVPASDVPLDGLSLRL